MAHHQDQQGPTEQDDPTNGSSASLAPACTSPEDARDIGLWGDDHEESEAEEGEEPVFEFDAP
eukprot:2862132-Amphidinium_carterae.1